METYLQCCSVVARHAHVLSRYSYVFLEPKRDSALSDADGFDTRGKMC